METEYWDSEEASKGRVDGRGVKEWGERWDSRGSSETQLTRQRGWHR